MSIRLRRAFTLVEIMIVAAIIAVILSVAIPNFLKAGRTSAKNACIANLKQIDVAIEQWATDKNMGPSVVPDEEQQEEMYSYIDGGRPTCPSKGAYTIYAVGSKPQVRCSREDIGHKLPEE